MFGLVGLGWVTFQCLHSSQEKTLPTGIHYGLSPEVAQPKKAFFLLFYFFTFFYFFSVGPGLRFSAVFESVSILLDLCRGKFFKSVFTFEVTTSTRSKTHFVIQHHEAIYGYGIAA